MSAKFSDFLAQTRMVSTKLVFARKRIKAEEPPWRAVLPAVLRAMSRRSASSYGLCVGAGEGDGLAEGEPDAAGVALSIGYGDGLGV